MDENENVYIDYNSLINRIADKAVLEFLSAIMPDEKSQKMLVGMLAIHRKYGIDAVTSIKIFQDIATLTKEVEQ